MYMRSLWKLPLLLRHVCGLLQDKIEELQASLQAVGAEAKGLSEQNTASEQELQVRQTPSLHPSMAAWCCQESAPRCSKLCTTRCQPCDKMAQADGSQPSYQASTHQSCLWHWHFSQGPCTSKESCCLPEGLQSYRPKDRPFKALSGCEQGLVEELKKLRAAEESAMTALVDEEMTARFSGDVTLTVRDTPTVLSPEQVRLCHSPVHPPLAAPPCRIRETSCVHPSLASHPAVPKSCHVYIHAMLSLHTRL